VANLKELFVISSTGGHPVTPSDQVDILRASILGHVLIDQAIKQFDFTNSDKSTHTFNAIVAYVSNHLPNLQNAAKASNQATANIMMSEAYLNLEAENKALKDKQAQGGANKNKRRKDGKGGKGKGKKQQKGKRESKDKETGAEKTLKYYCYAHGTQHTHISSECKLMAADKARFTSAMRNAKDPEHPSGGSTKVLGQSPQ
jgi:hypothetical protein